MTQRLAIVGASARAAAFSAIRAGHSVVTCDLFADADLRVNRIEAHQIESYPEGFLDWLPQQEVDGWLYTGGLENYPDLIDQLARQCRLLGNTGATLREVRSPTALAALLPEQFPETRESPNGLPADGSWLIKTYRGAGGSGVQRFVELGQEGANERRPQYWQRHIPGMPASATYVADGQHTILLGITEQLIGEAGTGAQEFQYCGSVAGAPARQKVRSQVEQIGDRLTEACGLRGVFGVDLILSEDKVWILEVNPRWPASLELLEQLDGYSAIELHLQACQPERLPTTLPTVEQSRHRGKAIVFAPVDVTISKKFTSDRITQSGSLVRPSVADIPNFDTFVPTGKPVCTVFAEGNNRDQVHSQLEEKVAELRGQLSHD